MKAANPAAFFNYNKFNNFTSYLFSDYLLKISSNRLKALSYLLGIQSQNR